MTETEKQDVLEFANFLYPNETFSESDLEQIKKLMDQQKPNNQPSIAAIPNAPQTQIPAPVTVELEPAYELAIMLMLVALGFYFDDATETLLFANGYAEYFPNTHSIFADSSRLYGDLDEYLANVATLDA